jgi:carboxyl-terminal processing protease
MDRKRPSYRLGLAVFMLVLMACTCVNLPTQLVTNPTASVLPTAADSLPTNSPVPPTPTSFATEIIASATPNAAPQLNANGVRICDFIPGVSQPAQMPPEVVNAATPTPYPLPTEPPNSTVDQATTDRQMEVFQNVWEAVNENYYDPNFRGIDWNAVGDKYRAMIEKGLTDDDFYLSMQLMINELGDDHSHYESPAEVKDEEQVSQGNNDFVGIGAISQAIVDQSRIIILSVFPGSPAERAGLRPHDALISVDGGPVTDENGTPRTLGPEGTTIVVSVQTPGQPPRDVTMTRSHVQGEWPIDSCIMEKERIGYIFLPTFLDETIDDQVREALEKMTADGPLNGLILDNRMNSGGSSAVVNPILGFFVSGKVGSFVGRNDSEDVDITPEDIGGSQTVPLVVLVSRESASYGEISSGILANEGRATVIGETTLGNVELLSGHDFSDGSLLWIATYTFQPTGQRAGIWEDTGIVVDFSVPTRWDLFVEGNDPALAKAVEVLMAGQH